MNLLNKKKAPIKNIDELRLAVHEACQHHTDIEIAKSEQDRLVAEVGHRFGGIILLAEKKLNLLKAKIETWARNNRSEWDTKQLAIDGSLLKFRSTAGKLTHPGTGPKFVKQIEDTADESFCDACLNYAPTLDKETCKAFLLDPESEYGQRLRDMGATIDKDENFTFTPVTISND